MGKLYPATCGATQVFAPLREEQLAAFEAEIGAALPHEYRAFLLEWNGVHFHSGQWNVYAAVFPEQPVEYHTDHTPGWDVWTLDARKCSDDSACDVNFLYGIGDDPATVLSKQSPGYDFDKWVPDRFLAIGESGVETRLCISLCGQDRGHIYRWMWPEGEVPVRGENCPTMDYMWWVASNFREFWDCLRPMSQEEFAPWQVVLPSDDEDEEEDWDEDEVSDFNTESDSDDVSD